MTTSRVVHPLWAALLLLSAAGAQAQGDPSTEPPAGGEATPAALSAREDTMPHETPKPQLIRLPFAYWNAMENTPVVFRGRPLLVLNYRDDSKGWYDHYADRMYLYLVDLRTGERIARFGKGYSCVKAFVDGERLHVFASEATNYEWFQSLYDFWTDDLQTWHRELALQKEAGEYMFNASVCRDDQGFLMAYVAYTDFPCFKFARSRDLVHWEKVPELVFAGQSGRQYSNTPAIRYFAPYYYVIFYTTVDETGRMVPTEKVKRYASFVARSQDLVTWQMSPLNPVLQPGPDEGISTSDVELMELEGNTYLFYAASTQTAHPPGWSAVRAALYLGPMRSFFEGWFPEGAKMEEVTTRRG